MPASSASITGMSAKVLAVRASVNSSDRPAAFSATRVGWMKDSSEIHS
jgi:hypothetical protein